MNVSFFIGCVYDIFQKTFESVHLKTRNVNLVRIRNDKNLEISPLFINMLRHIFPNGSSRTNA